MTNEADEGKEPPDDGKGIRDRALDESQSKVKDNRLKEDGDLNDRGRRELHAKQRILQAQQQLPQGTSFGWERFLHIPSIKVLLVENDDSTRHIVTALLRNCNYEVVEAANGVQAWKILEDLTNQVDVVLTEVVMPCLSGIGLLFKIMSHRTRKNVPVIMMSSHDSMGLVFKCLSKGAVDFLVKPVRKNELKNLWQHVWRRCQSSSGSGSESGAQTQKSVHTRSSEKSGNSSSNAGENNGSNGLNNADRSDDGSGTWSSWTKQPLEADSFQAPYPANQVAKCPDSNCAQVHQLNAETSSNRRVHITAKKEGQEEEQSGYKDPLLDTTHNLDSEPQSPIEIFAGVSRTKLNRLSEVRSSSSSSRVKKTEENPRGKFHSNKLSGIDVDLAGSQINGSGFEPPRELINSQQVNNNPLDNPRETAIELSLKRLRGIKGSEMTTNDNPDPLKHSELSAFSRYNTSTNTAKAPKGLTGSSYKNDDSLDVVNKDSSYGHTNGNLIFPGSNIGSNILDMGSATNKFSANPVFFSSEAASTVNVLHPFSAFKPVKNDLKNISELATQLKPIDMQVSSVMSPARAVQLELQIQHTRNHHHEHHYYHFHNLEQEQKLLNCEKSSTEKLVADAACCGSLNVLGGPEDRDPENCYANRSATGSNYGSNGQNGSSSAVNTGMINGESEALDGRYENRVANGSTFGKKVDENVLAQREAALMKFRQKRKERCFKKMVRYQNRKRLAEQRPRVRGQFVRKTEQTNSKDGANE